MTKTAKKYSLGDFFRPFKKRLWVIATFTILFTGGALFFEFFSPRLYEATAVIQLSSPESAGQAEQGDDSALAGTGRKARTEFLYSSELAERVAERLDISIEHQGEVLTGEGFFLEKEVDAEKNKKIRIEVIGRNPFEISRLANVWAEEFVAGEDDYRRKAVRRQILKTHKQLFSVLNKLEDIKSSLIEFIEENDLATQEEKKAYHEESLETKKPYLEEQIVAKSQFYKDRHPEMVVLKNKLKDIEEKLKEKETDKLFSLHNTASQYKILSKEFENYSSLYERSIEHLQELSDYEKGIKEEAKITKKASPPPKPLNPGSPGAVFLAGLLGLISGSLLSFGLKYLDHTIASSGEIEHLTDMSSLGELLYMKKEEKADMVCHLRPNSRLGEFFREIKATLYIKAPVILGVTSAMHKEGKTFVASNLAICFAHDKEKVLLIDADMRKGKLAEIYGVENNRGVTGILKGEVAPDEVIVPTKIPDLYIIPRGLCVWRPAELLLSPKLKETLEVLSKDFDRIIIDTPPVLHVADTLILSSACEGFIFIVKALSTPIKHVRKAAGLLERKTRLIGAVVNGFKTL
ncbi:MAG: polysaccharide biosynthesis tyrosine autokinase [Candidatus Omnitrophica bacterium]|nr:polysaccharide biosynthesis tyrosine autokinase [Candidatus Omnitrophota bacterium]MBD3269204.1 polysaccharide biosynthesis tyrosine autokinase [Candidatus Omnitrophota bacterium]